MCRDALERRANAGWERVSVEGWMLPLDVLFDVLHPPEDKISALVVLAWIELVKWTCKRWLLWLLWFAGLL